MRSDDLEFSVSQYLDGTLRPLEASTLEERLATDPEARKLLADYQELNATLKQSHPLPAINFDRLAEHLSATMANEPIPEKRLFIGTATWRRPAALALAASVVLAVGLALHLYTRSAPPTPGPKLASIDVKGPQAELAAAAPIVDITISPAPGVAENNWRVAEDVIYRPSRVTWLASSVDNSQDSNDGSY